MAHDTCATAEVIATLPYSANLNTTGQADDPSVPDDECGTGDSWNAYWLRWDSPTTARAVVATLGGANESTVTIFKGSCGSLVLIDPDFDFDGSCVYVGNPVEWVTEPGETYFFFITSFDHAGEAVLPFSVEVSAGTFCTTLSCGEAAPVVTGISLDCDGNRLSITGTDFAEFVGVTLTRNGVDTDDFTVVSVTSTLVVIQLNFDPALDVGEYCLTVTNPGPVVSNEFCATLSCPGRDGCAVTL